MGVRDIMCLHFDFDITRLPCTPTSSHISDDVFFDKHRQTGAPANMILLTWLSFEPLNMRVRGAVAVSGFSTPINVFVRRSLDGWKGYTDIDAVHVSSDNGCVGPECSLPVNENVTNHFFFNIELPLNASAGQRLSLALCCVDKYGSTWWNNNGGENFNVEIMTKPQKQRVRSFDAGNKPLPKLRDTSSTSNLYLNSRTSHAPLFFPKKENVL